jgi:uncharacterized protein YecE (DUF72 family)
MLKCKKTSGIRQVFEFRDTSWFNDEIYDILSKSNIGLCLADYPPLEKEPPLTADFVYVRRHGATALYRSCYTREQLVTDSIQIKNWLNLDKDVYVYFNNDAKGYAVQNALTLMELLNIRT